MRDSFPQIMKGSREVEKKRHLQGFMEPQRASISLGPIAEHLASAHAAGPQAQYICVPVAWSQDLKVTRNILHLLKVLRMCRFDNPDRSRKEHSEHQASRWMSSVILTLPMQP